MAERGVVAIFGAGEDIVIAHVKKASVEGGILESEINGFEVADDDETTSTAGGNTTDGGVTCLAARSSPASDEGQSDRNRMMMVRLPGLRRGSSISSADVSATHIGAESRSREVMSVLGLQYCLIDESLRHRPSFGRCSLPSPARKHGGLLGANEHIFSSVAAPDESLCRLWIREPVSGPGSPDIPPQL